MKILLLTPFLYSNRGNSTTAKRIASGLEQNGVDVTVFAYEEDAWNDEIDRQAKNCDLIHIIHFYRFSKWARKTNFQLNKPYIMTNGGTDVNLDLYNRGNRTEMLDILRNARAITVFTDDAKAKLCHAYSKMRLRIEVIKQSVWFPTSEENVDGLDLVPGKPAILLPSGLRAVKDVFFLMEEIVGLQKKYPNLQFLIAGMVLDENIYETLNQYIEKYSWIHFWENVPIENMVSLYKWAHIVLNTSISEGQSSAILEAMEMGCVVLARNNPGNASIIEDGVNGYLFNDGKEFLNKINVVLTEQEKAQRIIQNAKNFVQTNHYFEDEIKAFIKLYQDCLQKP
ncbi:glycosyltransferase [Schinkia azotoformans MEV2011]|uniref:Glycosyltransferase n=1 Tax=Schinkia azotoformans MEV2011 TaxID=1348973 RepID=A0A072NEK4_SCHAZ|nr:glycosyltransferase [Schinkia azotoformans]KEF35991.1 glycosyltransferase [Schinkia azotoformans MEV2011]MEC1696927.1 glycosyltransferase [Schinkia azotoformans]MEC1723343.1 glycosyltransferase [Schinkia azotoformans]MEC1772273.1 glycosyltransferase [Schinkia azotoformans]MED4365156.1 glycosyltransferase [Schinkia azotoformans]